MIRRLRGVLVERNAKSAVVDVHGVGYFVLVTTQFSAPLGEEVELQIYTHVREDALQLFGFERASEREVFEFLITVPTVGPVKAMGILDTRIEDLIALVRSQDVARLSKLPGVGKKTAERMVVDLRDKFDALWSSLVAAAPPSLRPVGLRGGLSSDLVSALTNLGFKPTFAEQAAQKALERLGQEATLEALLRDALAQGRPSV